MNWKHLFETLPDGGEGYSSFDWVEGPSRVTQDVYMRI